MVGGLFFIVIIFLTNMLFRCCSYNFVLQNRMRTKLKSISSSSSSASASASDFVSASTSPSTVKNLVLYDGVCRFCNTWVGVLLKLDTQGKFSYAALQSDSGKKALQLCDRKSDDISSIVYIPDEIKIDGSADDSGVKTSTRHYIKSNAVTEIVKDLGVPVGIVSNLLPLAFKDEVYDMVAENRYNLMGKYDECRLYDMEYEERFLK